MKKIALLLFSVVLAFSVSAQKLNSTKYYNLATVSSPVSINLASDATIFFVYGTKTLSTGFGIGVTGTPIDGKTIILFWDGTSLTTAGNTVTLMGVALTDAEAKRKMLVLSIYKSVASAWETRIVNDAHSSYWIDATKIDTTNFTDNVTLHIGTSGMYVKPASLTDTHIKASAAIARTKLAALTATRVMVTDGSGFDAVSTVTPTTLGYLDATSSIQTQLNTKPTAGAIINTDVNGSAAIAYSKLNLTGNIVNADINASAGIAYSKLALTGAVTSADLAGSIAHSKMAALTPSTVLVADGSGIVSSSSVTSTEMGYLSGVTSNIQSQISAAGAGKVTYSELSTTTILTAGSIKQNITVNTTGGGFVVTLPLANTVAAGTAAEFILHGANLSKITIQGGDGILNVYGASVSTDTLTTTTRSLMLYSDGSTKWVVGRKN